MVEGLKVGPVAIDGEGFDAGALEEGADSMSGFITTQAAASLLLRLS
jgi:hypothetical protein